MHVLVTLRYTMYRSVPAIMGIEEPGQVTLLLPVSVVGLAALQILVLLGRSAAAPDPAGPALPSDGVTGPNR